MTEAATKEGENMNSFDTLKGIVASLPDDLGGLAMRMGSTDGYAVIFTKGVSVRNLIIEPLGVMKDHAIQLTFHWEKPCKP